MLKNPFHCQLRSKWLQIDEEVQAVMRLLPIRRNKLFNIGWRHVNVNIAVLEPKRRLNFKRRVLDTVPVV